METKPATLDETKDMIVIKRSGRKEAVSFDKILTRVKKIGEEFELKINYTSLVIKVIDQLHDTISTSKIDELTAEQAASLSTKHPDYGVLASALVVSNLQKNTNNVFSEAMNELAINTLVTQEFINFVNLNSVFLNALIVNSRDYLIDYFGFKTLERAYLMHINKRIVERPQYMWLRVAISIHLNDLEKIKTTYDLLSQKYFTHATPTLYNAGTPRPQLSSCFLVAMEDDSVDGIYNTLKECANISQHAGGIGLHIHNIRATGSYIKGTNGTSNGIVPMLGVFNKTARYIDQGGGKRPGSFAIYIEPHHPDIEDFLDLKKNHGDEELRARDLFYALWISDLFMERVHTNSVWSLFCPNKAPGLDECYGEAFSKLYLDYEKQKKYSKQINARDLWLKILDSQIETGTPYMLYKDHIN
jgi:ribonucleotide reductase alpha subunit